MSARSLNKVMLLGNLTRDPELRYTPGGTAVCTFGLATNRSWTPSDGGEAQEETEFHRVVAWSKLAEICSQLLFKGRKVYVEGRLQTRRWTGQDGQERTTTEVVIDEMIALGNPRNSGGGGDYDESTPRYSQQSNDNSAEEVGSDVEETEVVEEESEVPEVSDKKSKKNESQIEEDVDVDDIPF